MVTTWEHPMRSSLRLVSSPIKLSATPVRADLPPQISISAPGELVRVLPEWEMPTANGWAVFPSRKLMPATFTTAPFGARLPNKTDKPPRLE